MLQQLALAGIVLFAVVALASIAATRSKVGGVSGVGMRQAYHQV